MRNQALAQTSGLLILIATMGFCVTVSAATTSKYANGWTASPTSGPTPGVDWTPLPPNPNPLGAPNANCTGTSNSGAVWAQFTFPGFAIPAGDSVVGIEVNVNYGNVNGATLQLYLSGSPVGMTRALGSTPQILSCGGSVIRTGGAPGDSWGAGLTAANFNAGGAVAVRITRNGNASIDIESVQMVVHHQGANGPPNALCQNVTRSANGSCQASVPAADVDDGSSDPDGDALSFSLSPAGPFNLGGTAVMLTVTDPSSASAMCNATITVNDDSKPMISCPANVTLNADANSCQATYAGPAATAVDNCPGLVVGGSPTLPALFSGVGSNSIVYSATDGSGNAAMCTQTVTVIDVTDPVITLNGPSTVNVECPMAYVEQGASAADGCAGSVPVSISGVVDETTPGTYVVTYTASDGNGNTATATRTVIVQDTTDPVLTLNGDNPLVLECAVDSYIDPGATVIDACDSSPSLEIVGAVNEGAPGSYPITYTATDASGNASQAVRTVVVEDTLPPEITPATDRLVLWPPNHKYRMVDLIDVVDDASDLCDSTVAADDVVIAEVSSDEEENGKGDGNTVDDIVIAGGECRTVELRAERRGRGDGRIYTLNLEATDASGNVGGAHSQIEVPHNKKDVAFDSGPRYWEISDCASLASTSKCGPLEETELKSRGLSESTAGECMAVKELTPEQSGEEG